MEKLFNNVKIIYLRCVLKHCNTTAHVIDLYMQTDMFTLYTEAIINITKLDMQLSHY